jgi:hypothetical protein
MGWRFRRRTLARSFFKGKESLTMDRVLSKWIAYAVIGLAVLYLWMHSDSIAPELRAVIGDWWK